MRAVAASDVDAIAAALARVEGYTVSDEVRASAFTTAALRAEIAPFADGGSRGGLVVEDAGAMAGFLLFIHRGRADPYPAGHIIPQLPASLFPADGRFLQIHDLWVAPTHRRRGLATTLKRAAEQVAAEAGAGAILSFTETTHVAALRLNAALGYRVVFEGPMWDAVARVALIKFLPTAADPP
jgi:ribosomal protein S18 acetylase RimI-like enzyme